MRVGSTSFRPVGSFLCYGWLLLFLLFAAFLSAQVRPGQLLENEVLQSKVLGKAVNYAVYLPPDYHSSQRSYPIVYLLHGYTDNHTGWTQFGEIAYLLDDAIAPTEVTPMIVVMPDAGVSWYVDNFDGSVKYEEFFIREFLPIVEKTYRTRNDRRYRGIAGLSMGGYGSLLYALKHPDLFSAVAPLSAALYTEADVLRQPQDRWEKIESVVYGPGLEGEARLTQHWRANNVFEIVRSKSKEELKALRYWFDIGDEDFLYRGNSELHILLRDQSIPHEFRVRDGGHTWSYWRSGIIPALQFITEGFHQK